MKPMATLATSSETSACVVPSTMEISEGLPARVLGEVTVAVRRVMVMKEPGNRYAPGTMGTVTSREDSEESRDTDCSAATTSPNVFCRVRNRVTITMTTGLQVIVCR